MAFARNTRTGKTVSVPDHYIGHEVLGKDLEPLDGAEVQAAPKKEKKSKFSKLVLTTPVVEDVIEEQPAPEIDIESNEENN